MEKKEKIENKKGLKTKALHERERVLPRFHHVSSIRSIEVTKIRLKAAVDVRINQNWTCQYQGALLTLSGGEL